MTQDWNDLLSRIRQALQVGDVYWTNHALKRLRKRQIMREEVFQVIQHGTILERYPQSQPFPSCLMMEFVRNDEPLYAVLAFDGQSVIMVTVHWFDPEKWFDPWTRRR